MTKVLITVKTYPNPSVSYKELVCTAGITEDYNWVRLYPINYRYLERQKQYKKYQWIDVDFKPRKEDNRLESREPILSTLKIVSGPIPTTNKWELRNTIIDNVQVYTLLELKKLNDIEKRSLGIVKPSEVFDVKVTKDKTTWKPEHEALLRQLTLFGDPIYPLAKIPYKFQYVFKCHDSKNVHNAMITDWELGALFLKEVKRLGSEERAAESVKNKYLNVLCDDKNDFKFFMGTTRRFNAWIVLGVYYPPKKQPNQETMF